MKIENHAVHSLKIEGGEVEEKPKTGEDRQKKNRRRKKKKEEERRTRLEAFLKSWQLCLSFKLDVLTT